MGAGDNLTPRSEPEQEQEQEEMRLVEGLQMQAGVAQDLRTIYPARLASFSRAHQSSSLRFSCLAGTTSRSFAFFVEWISEGLGQCPSHVSLVYHAGSSISISISNLSIPGL